MNNRSSFLSNWEYETHICSQDSLRTSAQRELWQLAAAEPRPLQSVHGWQSKHQLTVWVHSESEWQENEGEQQLHMLRYNDDVICFIKTCSGGVEIIFPFALSSVAGHGPWVYQDAGWATGRVGAAWFHCGEFFTKSCLFFLIFNFHFLTACLDNIA